VPDLPARVLELAERAAADEGAEVVEARLTGGRAGRTLQVVVDAEAGVEADVVERIARHLSRALDEADPIQASYTLEVASPGLDRPLRSARDFRRQTGHQVRLVLSEGEAIEGTVLGADDDAVTLAVDGAGTPVTVALAAVRTAKVVLPW
jgi:ribosome maturation factor RimP